MAWGRPSDSLPVLDAKVEARGKGITRSLLAAAVDFAKDHGATAVEGFPLADGPKGRADGHLGTEQVFAACGFTELRRPTERRVVMRRELQGQG